MTITDPVRISTELAGLGANLYLRAIEFRETHSHLHVRLTGLGFRDVKGDLYFSDCVFVRFQPVTGPVSIELSETVDASDQRVWIARGLPGQFEVHALKLALDVPTRP